MGYALVSKERCGWSVKRVGVVRLKAEEPLSHRLLTVYRTLSRWCRQWRPDGLVVEDLHIRPYGQKSVLTLAQCVGLLYLVAAENRLPIATYPMTTVKKVVSGDGSRPRSFLWSFLVQYVTLPRSLKQIEPDAVDALALAVCHLLLNRQKAVTSK